MPKIIENIQARLIEEARRQIETEGYGTMTIRSVAKSCGVGVGTVYNYFPSKDDLLATYLLSDWKDCIAAIDAVGAETDCAETVLRCIYDQLTAYAQRHSAVFQDKAAAVSFAGSFSKNHARLRSQLAAPVRRFCESDFAAEFVAESLLVWTMDGKPFAEIFRLIGKLL